MLGGGSWVQRLRLLSGLVLFAFVVPHLLNHALGLISLEAMEAGRTWFLAVWRNPVGTTLLYGALATHLCLAVARLFRGRGLRMPAWEAAQALLGLSVPFLIALHLIGTRGVELFWGMQDTYAWVLWATWPGEILHQTLLLVVVWLHACIGLHFWLRLRPWYRHALPWCYAGALLLPLLAWLGFAQAGRQVAALATERAWVRGMLAEARFPGEAVIDWAYTTETWVQAGFVALVLAILAVRLGRLLHERRRGGVRIAYPDGRIVSILPGTTVLEASRAAGIPHASVCGGRGRCSTCRVRLGRGRELLPPPHRDEAAVLTRVGAPESVRLACQLRPSSDIDVTPLLPAAAGPRDAGRRPGHHHGVESEIAIMFADLRAFTALSEGRLPYDVVFLLNAYFRAMGVAIEAAGGHVDKFIGDGVMALFGIGSSPEEGCRQALAAARTMAATLDELNRALDHDLAEPLRIGIGLHAGPVIVGEMGYRAASSVTAIGDAVNVASRLEAMTKELGCQVVVSNRVARLSGVDLSAFLSQEIQVRGRTRPLRVFAIPNGKLLPEPEAARGATPGAP